MVKESVYTLEILGKEIKALVVRTDDGITVTLAGGDKSHIGAIAISDGMGHISTTTFPGHKETVIAETWAKELYEKYRFPVVVACGIHYDNINKTGIEKVVKACNELLVRVQNN